MRTIVKSREPERLAEYRATPGATYDEYRDKEDLRRSLVSEQRGLCCYCLSRIRADAGSMKIEHWHSQERYPSEQLDYRNLLAACKGNDGNRSSDKHCDTSKGNRDLSRNPANPDHRTSALIQFRGDGTVRSTEPTFNDELDQVLNLNLPFLVANRKAVLTAFTGAITKNGPLTPEWLKRRLSEWNGERSDGDLQPFCQVVVYWIHKRLARERPADE